MLFFRKKGASSSLQVIETVRFKNTCSYTDITFFNFIIPKQQNHLSHLNISDLIDENLTETNKAVLEAKIIDWDSYELKVEA